jgi:hypothetical protein
LKDKRHYDELPPRLRPSRYLDVNSVNSEVLTTYAGLVLRDLLDRFGGDVDQAIGAYNGGIRNPNPAYAAGVKNVALYARRGRSAERHGAVVEGERIGGPKKWTGNVLLSAAPARMDRFLNRTSLYVFVVAYFLNVRLE